MTLQNDAVLQGSLVEYLIMVIYYRHYFYIIYIHLEHRFCMH